MGFTTGFTGGVTLTLGVAYLTVLAHQRNRERQSAILRSQTTVISSLTDPLPPVHPPTRTELAAAERANLVEQAKDRWNAEIEGAVRWVQVKDWDEVREGAEAAVGRLWAKAFGEAGEQVGRAEHKAGVLAGEAEKQAAAAAGSVTVAAKAAYADTKAKGSEAAAATRGSVLGAIGRGIEKGKEVLGVAKAAATTATDAATTLSPVEKTLRQRYEQPSGLRSVEETLADRYTPLDKRDNTVLRGL